MPLPILELEDIRIASPCDASWNQMTGDERVRFCGQCQKNVYNLSRMRRAEALALVQRSEGRICVRFYQRKDGTVISQDCPVGLAAALRRGRRATGAAVAAMVGAIVAVLSAGIVLRRGGHGRGLVEALSARPMMMGEVAPVMGVAPAFYEKVGDIGPSQPPQPVQGGIEDG